MIVEDLIGRQLGGYQADGVVDIQKELDTAIELDKFLGDGKRECLVLIMLLRGYTQDEIAEALQITRMTVVRDVKRARELLRKRLI
jgi:DNA-directed RNA polymerase specialized sigma24 family protein